SFNFGPTLLSWLQEKSPETYRAIQEADRESQKNFSGHGSAMAQAYNHMIMPLSNRRDRITQVIWGIHDFEHRFKRRPEGMWLPETAVDLETLSILADHDMRFTVLAPRQASRVRRLGARNWRDVSGERIDPSMAYEQRLPSGKKIALFFYDGPISRGVAFERLLGKGETFANRLLGAFADNRTEPQLVHIATDGESYGHHHRFGDMALAYALHYIESKQLAKLTNYAEHLGKYPPTHQVEVFENSSWSCAHGVERWKSDCGCNSGGNGGWNQAWRGPLREALDWLRDSLAFPYEQKAGELLNDPWSARDGYIRVILDRSPQSVQRFIAQYAKRELNESEKITALKLLELQRHAMLMYTSCGWFFDELSGIETIQIVQYAGRAVQLAHELFGDWVEPQFLERLELAKCNVPEHRDGRLIYEKFVKPAVVDWERVGAHYAISSIFEDYGEQTRVYCYRAHREQYKIFTAGKAKMVVGRVRLTSEITAESASLSFGTLHFGDHNLNGGVREFQGEAAYRALVQEVEEPFSRADLPDVIRLVDKHFGESTYSLRSLFRDEQRKVSNLILESSLAEAEAVYRQLYENHAPMMRFLTGLGIPLPRAFYTAAEFVLSAQLRRALDGEELDADMIRALLEEARLARVQLDAPSLSYSIQRSIERLADGLYEDPGNSLLLEKLETAATFALSLPFEVDLWKVQNRYYEVLRSVFMDFREKAGQGDESARAWVDRFTSLGAKLSVLVA
ncbi:MAG TPA: DUF3536 domain-containing protein, partial [Candidatus Binatia bacterium]